MLIIAVVIISVVTNFSLLLECGSIDRVPTAGSVDSGGSDYLYLGSQPAIHSSRQSRLQRGARGRSA